MAADASAYAVLGLDPGAEWSAVERAYKTLIKAHHPDRPGGDADRAAEINRAYRELRRERAWELDGGSWAEQQVDPWAEPPLRRWRWLGAALAIVAATGLVVLLAGSSNSLVSEFRTRAAPLPRDTSRLLPATTALDPMDQPLDGAAVNAGVAGAARLEASGNEAAMAEAARNCQGALRSRPSLSWLDRCAAFDDAIVQLENRDPWRDDGPFSQVAVTGREMSAANLLSDDFVAIDGRLDRIRLAVEVTLAPSTAADAPERDPDLNAAD